MSAATHGCHTKCHQSGYPRPLLSRRYPKVVANYGSFVGRAQQAWFPGSSVSHVFEAPPRGSIIAHARRKWYAIFEPAAVRGVYRVWEQVQRLVSGQSNAVHRGFPSEAAALEWISHLMRRSKEEDAALEQLRQMILGPNYPVGQPAALVSGNKMLTSHTTGSSRDSDSKDAGGAVATAEAASAPTPRPWQTAPIVLPVATTPTREFYRKWYAVRFVDGGTPGVYNTWQEAEASISGRYAEHRSFDSQAEALVYAFGPSYVEQLLPQGHHPSSKQQQQQRQQQSHQHQEQLEFAQLGYDADFAAEAEAGLQSELLELPVDYNPYNKEPYFRHGVDDSSEATEWASEGSFVPYSGVSGFQPPVLAAWDAAISWASPTNPSMERGGLHWPLPAPPAMSMPLSYDTFYGGPAPAMVLTAAATPARAGHGHPRHQQPRNRHNLNHPNHDCIAGGVAGPRGASLLQPPCAAPNSSSSFSPPSTSYSIFAAGLSSSSSSSSTSPLAMLPLEAVLQPPHGGATDESQEDFSLLSYPLTSFGGAAGAASTIGHDIRFGAFNEREGARREDVTAATAYDIPSTSAAATTKGRRGRPRKALVANLSPNGIAVNPPGDMQTKRPRGRPRKQPSSDVSGAAESVDLTPKRGRGRPRKPNALNEPAPVPVEAVPGGS